MLAKLLKYDFKAINRFAVIIHLFMLGTAILFRIIIMNRIRFNTTDLNTVFITIMVLLISLLFMGTSFSTYIVIAIRFYKNLYSDEGYLSHTLPVTKGQHLLSKFIAGGIWSALDSLLVVLSVYILLSTTYIKNLLADNKNLLLKELGFENMSEVYKLFFLFIIYLILSAFFSVLIFYMSITIGQLFSGHAVLGSVIAYFSVSTVISILYAIIMAVANLLTVYGQIAYDSEIFNYNLSEYITKVFRLSCILSVIVIPIFYLVTYILMKKKNNLS